jgi:hypothetical protein
MPDAPTPQSSVDPGDALLSTLAVPEPARRRLASLGGLWPYLRPYRSKLGVAFVLLCLGSAAMLAVQQPSHKPKTLIHLGTLLAGHLCSPGQRGGSVTYLSISSSVPCEEAQPSGCPYEGSTPKEGREFSRA